jgi:CarD family transcriptional regulator
MSAEILARDTNDRETIQCMTKCASYADIPETAFSRFERKRTTESSKLLGDLRFSVSDEVVYPAHGVGRIVSIVQQEIAGVSLELFVISFEKDKMTLRVPTAKATSIGMRLLSSPDLVAKALDILRSRGKVNRAMWSRRAQEYEQKVNSGALVSIAEVVRDLYRADQTKQPHSERRLYEAAFERLTREVAAIEHVKETNAATKIEAALNFKAD